MSITGWVLALSSAQIGVLRATPSLASDLARVAEHDHFKETVVARMSPERRRAYEEQQRALIDATPAVRAAEAELVAGRARLAGIGPYEQALDLQKSWHILHYLFTGHIDVSNAPGDALLTGQELGEDVGYGPARLHDERAAREFASFLAALDLARLQARVNFRDMTRVRVYGLPFGLGSDTEHEGDVRAAVASYFPRLRDYMARVSEKGEGFLTWLS